MCVYFLLEEYSWTVNAQKPRNVKLKLKVNSLSIESENESGVFSIYTLAPRRGRVNILT